LLQLSEYAVFDFNTGLDNLFAPAGLDIGSESPEEIALSIVGEVAATLSDRVGGFLRERRADVHSPVTTVGGQAA
jgi:xanthine/CO dehydrogenase XdhC/CoxF family maturation factor